MKEIIIGADVNELETNKIINQHMEELINWETNRVWGYFTWKTNRWPKLREWEMNIQTDSKNSEYYKGVL